MTTAPPLFTQSLERPLRVLVVCTGNICRSPAAALLMERHEIFGAGAHYESAGLGAVVGAEIDPPMQTVLDRVDGIDMTAHRARQINETMINKADIVITMTVKQRSKILGVEPQALGKVVTLAELGHLVRCHGRNLDLAELRRLANQLPAGLDLNVADPHRRGDEAMQVSVLEILRSLSMIIGTPLVHESLTVARPNELRVMTSARASDDRTSAYMAELMNTMQRQPGMVYEAFSWRTALLGRVDVFHSHWPEAKLESPSALKRVGRRFAFWLMTLNFAVRKTAVVQTLHNLAPHEEPSAGDQRLIARFRKHETLRISINSTTPHDAATPIETILHGEARTWFNVEDLENAEPGHVAYFGLIRAYKGVEDLLRAFREVTQPLRLTVAGNPSPPELAHEITELAGGDPRVELHLGHVPNRELAQLISRSTLIVLPYRKLHNSGAAITALSLKRPVLVPRNDSTDALGAEVGEQWVIRFDGELTAEVIQQATSQAEHVLKSGESPDLSRRSWDLAGEQHAAVFAEAHLRAELGRFRKSASR